jgi:ribosomal-protein-alanine N-acetyltransferase
LPIDHLFDKIPVLTTRRLRLRPGTLGDAEELASRIAPAAIPWRRLAELPEASEPSSESNLMVEPFSLHHPPPWIIEPAAGGEAVGACILLQWSIPDARAEIACIFAAELDRADASDVIDTLLDFGFGIVELNRIEARCEAGDARMTALYEAAGLRREAVLRQQVRHDGGYRDMSIFSRLSDDSPSSHPRTPDAEPRTPNANPPIENP